MSALAEYMKLEDEVAKLHNSSKEGSRKEEEDLLDRMDVLWHKMSGKEHEGLNSRK